MAKDFRAGQVRTGVLIASGCQVSGKTGLGLMIYSSSVASDFAGTRADSNMLDDVGTDVWLFVSGTSNIETYSPPGQLSGEGVTLFGGDVVVSGTFYADKMIIELDQSATGSLMVSGSLFVSQSVSIGSTNPGYGPDLSPAGVLEIQGDTVQGMPTLFITHEDDNVVGVDLNINNETANAIDIDATSTTSNVLDITTTTLTSGKALKVYAGVSPADSSSETQANIITVANPSTTTQTAVGLKIDYNKTGATASAKASTVYGLMSDLDDSGTNVAVSVLVSVAGDATASSGAGTVYAFGGVFSATVSTADSAIGLQSTATGGTNPIALRLRYDNEEHADFTVSSSGLLTIATTDDSSDTGAITLDTVDKITLNSDTADQGIVYADGADELLQIYNDGSSNVIFKILTADKTLTFADDTANGILQLGEQVGAIFNEQAASTHDFRVEGTTGWQGAILFDAGTTQIGLLTDGITAADAYGLKATTDPIPVDVGLFVSGTIGGKDAGSAGSDLAYGVTLFGGDLVVSGNIHLDNVMSISGSADGNYAIIKVGKDAGAGGKILFQADDQNGADLLEIGEGSTNSGQITVNPDQDGGGVDFIVKTSNRSGGITVDATEDQIAILGNGSYSGDSYQDTISPTGRALPNDVALWISGAIGGKDETAGHLRRGTAVFAGDLVVSGATHLVGGYGGISDIFSLTSSLVDIGWDPGSSTETDGPTLRLSSHDAVVDTSTTVGTIIFGGSNDASTPPAAGDGAKIIGKPTAGWAVDGTFPTELQFHTTTAGSAVALLATMTATGLNLASGKNFLCNGTEAIASDGEVAIASQPNITTLAALNSFGAIGTTTNIVAGDLTMYNAVNNGNPTISLGSSAADRLIITAEYNSGAQTLDAVVFATVAAGTGKGAFIFDVDGTEIFEITAAGVIPSNSATFNLGSDTARWDNIYTSDLHLKNERGDWTVIEEEEYLSLRNNKTGKRYKFVLEEIDED